MYASHEVRLRGLYDPIQPSGFWCRSNHTLRTKSDNELRVIRILGPIIGHSDQSAVGET